MTLLLPAGFASLAEAREVQLWGGDGAPGVCTWEDEDEAGCQASNDRDDLADVRDKECKQQGEQEPHQCLQDSAPPLQPHVLLHWHPLVAQP